MLKYITAHIDIQYSNETDEQYRKRAAAMQAHNDEVDRIAREFDAPMKGLREGWDCGCWFSCTFRGGDKHKYCPRRE